MPANREFKYCKCGQPVITHWLSNGISNFPIFQDENGDMIVHCPSCGERLTVDTLVALGEL